MLKKMTGLNPFGGGGGGGSAPSAMKMSRPHMGDADAKLNAAAERLAAERAKEEAQRKAKTSNCCGCGC